MLRRWGFFLVSLSAVTICLSHSRGFSAVKNRGESANTSAPTAGHPGAERQADDADVTVPMMSQSHFIDTKVLNAEQSMLQNIITFLVNLKSQL